MPTLQTKTQQTPGEGRFHWTVNTLYRAIDAGVFDEPKRLELINGELWEKEIMNPPHASTTRRIFRLLAGLLEPDLLVMQEAPLHIANDGEPLPDIMVVSGTLKDYETRHPIPAEVRLLIEVADATDTRDQVEKALLYAQAGITDYWVSLVARNRVRVFRDPTPTGFAFDETYEPTESISPLAAPQIRIRITDLLPRTESATANSRNVS